MVISVQCTSCSTSFPVDTAKVPEEGVYARCSVCSSVFFVERPLAALAEVAAAGRGETREAEPWSPPAAETWTPSAPESFDVAVEPTSEEGAPDEAVSEVVTEPDEPLTSPFSETPPAEPEPFVIDTAPVDEPPDPEPTEPTESYRATEAATPSVEPSAAPAGAFSFGRRDPHDKARRLARVLVSDMIMYNPERHSRAIAQGSLREDFDDEIKKSWEEYVDQIGEELARGTSYFDDALNEILARGQRVFP